MGAPKQKWTTEEEAALKVGIAKHGIGKWSTIIKDPEFSIPLHLRTNVELKVWCFSSRCSESQREAALLLGQFAATDTDCKVHIVQRGAVGPLIEMLQLQDARLKEMSAFALGRLAKEPLRINLTCVLSLVNLTNYLSLSIPQFNGAGAPFRANYPLFIESLKDENDGLAGYCCSK